MNRAQRAAATVCGEDDQVGPVRVEQGVHEVRPGRLQSQQVGAIAIVGNGHDGPVVGFNAVDIVAAAPTEQIGTSPRYQQVITAVAVKVICFILRPAV